MLRRLTSGRKWQAAWLLSLIYVLTVLAPASANAFGPNAHAVAPQATETLAHDRASDGHDHAAAHVDGSGLADSGQNHHGNGAGGLKCCGLACIGALPAHDVDVVRPDRVPSAAISFVYQTSAGRSPPRLYRPPIS